MKTKPVGSRKNQRCRNDIAKTDHKSINRLFRFTSARQSKLIEVLPREGATAWDASTMLFPGAKSYHRFLALSETAAHLDYAVAEGRLLVELKGEHEIYKRV